LKPTRVIIADNSRDLTMLLKETLEETGEYSVTAVHNGEQAYAMITEQSPDVLITEVILPGLDGISLLRKLKDEGLMPRTILFSAFWTESISRTARLLGVGNCLEKPCRVEVLLRMVGELCEPSDSLGAPDPIVRQTLTAFGIPSHLVGYNYLAEGLSRILHDRSCLQGITKSLYRDLGKACGASAPAVERAMRNAVAKGWERLTAEERRRRFGSVFDSYDKAPGNQMFLAAMAEYIELSSCGIAMTK